MKLRFSILTIGLGLAMAAASCKSVKVTTTQSADTITRLVIIPAQFDTSIHLPGAAIQLTGAVDVTGGLAQMPEQTVRKNGITTRASVRDGKLNVESSTEDTVLRIRGTTAATVPQTTIREKVVKTITEKPSALQRVWNGIKNFLLEIVVIIVLLVVVYAFIKRK